MVNNNKNIHDSCSHIGAHIACSCGFPLVSVNLEQFLSFLCLSWHWHFKKHRPCFVDVSYSWVFLIVFSWLASDCISGRNSVIAVLGLSHYKISFPQHVWLPCILTAHLWEDCGLLSSSKQSWSWGPGVGGQCWPRHRLTCCSSAGEGMMAACSEESP